MKKIAVILCMLLIFVTPALADKLLLDGVGATGASIEERVRQGTAKHTVTCYYVDANASITALIIDLEGSTDPRSVNQSSAHWFQLAEHTFTAGELTAKQAMFHVVNKAVNRVRVNITTLTGAAGEDAVSAYYHIGR